MVVRNRRARAVALTAGAMQASDCRQGSFLMIKGHPCKIVAMSTSKTGKHGHAKCKFMATDIFDGTKHEMIETSTHNVSIPNVSRQVRRRRRNSPAHGPRTDRRPPYRSTSWSASTTAT